MQKITPFLWFDNNSQEAAEFYTSVFKNSKITSANPSMVSFNLEGQEFMALNGGPNFKFTEAVSFFVTCEDQDEVDYYWEKLSADPSSEKCGWLKDKYGLSWQIIPKQFNEMMANGDQEKAGRVMQALLKMKKIDIQKLQDAYES